MFVVLLLAFAAVAQAAPEACPKAIAPAVEAKLLPVLNARDEAIRNNDWLDPQYENAIETLLQAKDAASSEARVALMDYAVGDAYDQELVCAVAYGGKAMIPLLQRYARCDIAPAHSTSARDHASPLRGLALKYLTEGSVSENCNFD